MATRAAAVLAALLLTSASAAPSAQLGKDSEAHEPLYKKAEALDAEVQALKTEVAEAGSPSSSADSPADCSTCEGVKTELGAKVDELTATVEKLAVCKDNAIGKWQQAVGDLLLEQECKQVDLTMQQVNKELLESDCQGSGAVTVQGLWVEAKERCLVFCRSNGGETGRALARQFCSHEEIKLGDNAPKDDAPPLLEGKYLSGTVVYDCNLQQGKGCKDIFWADAQKCETPRSTDADFAKAIGLCTSLR